MLGKIARGAVLVILAVMIAAWALTAVKSEPPSQYNDQPAGRMYS